MSANTKQGYVDNVGDLLIESLREAVAVERGERPASTIVRYTRDPQTGTLRRVVIQPPPQLEPAQIAAIRRRHGWSQSTMASVFGVSPRTVEAWEQGRRRPPGPALRLLQVLEDRGVLTDTLGAG